MSFSKASIKTKLDALADRNIFIGTSSWKYEGWLGQLYSPERYEYRGKVAKSRFEAGCLEEYAETFKTVCVDAGFYRFPDERYIERLCSQVPERFKFSFKVTDEITVKNFPKLPRHGERGGRPNENFLNARLFQDAFLGPCSGYRDKIGIVMFEFSHFYPKDFERGRDFVAALDQFLSELPNDWQYGVEIRNPGFLQEPYFEMLSRHKVSHVFNSWTAMPSVTEQMATPKSFTTDFHASRFLLKPGRKYEDAVEAFSPYTEAKDAYPEARQAIKELIRREAPRPSYIFINNRLEGSALATIAAVLNEEDQAEPSSVLSK